MMKCSLTFEQNITWRLVSIFPFIITLVCFITNYTETKMLPNRFVICISTYLYNTNTQMLQATDIQFTKCCNNFNFTILTGFKHLIIVSIAISKIQILIFISQYTKNTFSDPVPFQNVVNF